MAAPLARDTLAEIAQPEIRDWLRGEVEPVPGKTMPALSVVSRDYRALYDQFVALGPLERENGLGAHGTDYPVADFYGQALESLPAQYADYDPLYWGAVFPLGMYTACSAG